MNRLNKAFIILQMAAFLPIMGYAQTAERELHYWGSPENYLNAQGMVILDLVNEALDQNPPSIKPNLSGKRALKPNLVRKQALYMLDAVLHDTRYDGSDLIKDFLASRVDRVLSDLEKPMNKNDRVKIYKIYNDGFVIRSREVTIAVDLCGKSGTLIADEQMRRLVAYCEALFITHNHSDHCDDNVVSMFTVDEKPVYAIANYVTTDEGVSLIRWDKPKEMKVQFTDCEVKVMVFPGHQDELINNIYVFYLPNGFSVAHLGDQHNQEDMVWIREIGKEVKNLDVLIINCWSNDFNDYVKGFNPKLIISGHENELGHTIDHREAFWLTYYKFGEVYKLTKPYVIMGWGEWFNFKSKYAIWHK